MAIGVGTNVVLRFKKEATRGTAETGAGFAAFRGTTRNINLKKDILESAEVSSTRQRSDVRHGFNRVEGDIGFEFALQAYDELLAYAMGRANTNQSPATNTAVLTASSYDGWLKPATVSGTNLSIDTFPGAGGTAATGSVPGILVFKLTNAGASTNWIDLGYRPGDWVVSSGWANANNNSGGTNPAEWRVLSVTGALLTVQIPAGFTSAGVTATGAAGNAMNLQGRRLSIGTTMSTLTIERGFTDVPLYQVFRGCAINQLSLTIRPETMVGGSMRFIGMAADIDNTATTTSGTVTAAATNSPFSAVDGAVNFVDSAGAHFSGTITGCDFTLDNQRSLFAVVGSRYSPDVFEGTAKVTGTVTIVLDSASHLQAFFDESTLSTMVIRLAELGGSPPSFISLVFNRVKYTAADIDPPQNGPVVITCPFEALEQTFLGQDGLVETKEVFRIQRSNV